MIADIHTCRKTEAKCDKCGVNLHNVKLRLYEKSGGPIRESIDPITHQTTWLPHPNSWQHPYCRRGFHSSQVNLCFDCAVEVMNNLAKDFLEKMKHFDMKKVVSSEELKELAAIRHERHVYTKRVKEDKAQKLEMKRKERNTGLDVVSSVI